LVVYVVRVWVGLLCCGLLDCGLAVYTGITGNSTHSLLFLSPHIIVVWLLLVMVSIRLPALFRLCVGASLLLILLLL
jgi:hypothetical protein